MRLVIVICLLLLPPYLWAGNFEDGLAAREAGNFKKAVELYRISAEQGMAEAQHNLGVMYEHGLGVPKDHQEAIKWYLKAADQGLAVAQHNLGGIFYSGGNGVTKDYIEAARWFAKAAEQGMAEAQHNLGIMCFEGQGVTQNYALAHMWFNLACAGGVAASDKERDLVAKRMNATQIAKAQDMAKKKAAEIEKRMAGKK